MGRLALVALVLLVCLPAVHAAVDVRVVAMQSPPLTLTNISAGWPAPAWASEAHRALKADPDILPLYLQVQNTSTKPIYSYRIAVATYDPFGDYLDTCRATTIMNLAPQGTDYGRWSLRVRTPVLTWFMVAYLDCVRFADGSVWRIDPEGVAALIPSTAPVRFQAWHIMADPMEIISQYAKDPA